MSIESTINNKLNQYPKMKKRIKRAYQLFRYLTSKKIKSEGNIIQITPKDGFEYFYGYYDKSPWSGDEKYMICLRAKCTYKNVAPKEKAEIILIKTSDNSIRTIAETSTWNVQQGCMLQWLGPDFNEKIIYNDFRNNHYCSIILNVFTGEEKVIDYPIYDVSKSGDFALTLDFSRLHRLRPGYGYYNLKDIYANVKIPDAPCIWKVDLNENSAEPILKYTDFFNFEQREDMINAEHKVNHIMISPNDKRFMVLHRWYQGERKYSRLITINVDGTEMYNLSDDDMVSHCYWKNENEVIAFENKKGIGPGYYLMVDKTNEHIHLWKHINNDGHPSYSPNGNLIVIDSYPNGKRISSIKIMCEDKEISTVVKVFSPFKYDNDVRCDLHPRWDRKNEKICFDSAFEGKRGLYIVQITNKKVNRVNCDIKYEGDLVSVVIPTYKRSLTLKRAINSVLNQTYKKIEILVVDDNNPNTEDCHYVKKIINEYKHDQRVKYIEQKCHVNGAVARNQGIMNSRGEYISFLDDDDEWAPEKIEKQLKYLKSNPKIDGVSCLYKIYNNELEVRSCQIYDGSNFHWKVISRQVSVFTSTILLKRNKLDKTGYFDENLLRHQDLQFLLDFLGVNKMDVVKEYLVKLHSDSEINHPNLKKTIEIKNCFFNVCQEHFNIYKYRDRKRIFAAHYFEIVVLAIKSRNFFIMIKYLFKIGININAYRDLYRRWKLR